MENCTSLATPSKFFQNLNSPKFGHFSPSDENNYDKMQRPFWTENYSFIMNEMIYNCKRNNWQRNKKSKKKKKKSKNSSSFWKHARPLSCKSLQKKECLRAGYLFVPFIVRCFHIAFSPCCNKTRCWLVFSLIVREFSPEL